MRGAAGPGEPAARPRGQRACTGRPTPGGRPAGRAGEQRRAAAARRGRPRRRAHGHRLAVAARRARRCSPARSASSSRCRPDFPEAAAAQVRDWQGAVLDLVRSQGADKRSRARLLSWGVNGAGAVVMVAVFAQTGGLTGGEIAVAGGTTALGQRVLEAVFGDAAVRSLAARAREDLRGAGRRPAPLRAGALRRPGGRGGAGPRRGRGAAGRRRASWPRPAGPPHEPARDRRSPTGWPRCARPSRSPRAGWRCRRSAGPAPLLAKAGARAALGDATVVALAGATGSGKSTLFNALSGGEISSPGRPPADDRASPTPRRGASDGRRPAARLAGGAAPAPARARSPRWTGWSCSTCPTTTASGSSTGWRSTGWSGWSTSSSGCSTRRSTPTPRCTTATWCRWPAHAGVLLVVLNQVDRLDAAGRAGLPGRPAGAARPRGARPRRRCWPSRPAPAPGVAELRGELARRVAARRAATDRLTADVRGAAADARRRTARPTAPPGRDAGTAPTRGRPRRRAGRRPPASRRSRRRSSARRCGTAPPAPAGRWCAGRGSSGPTRWRGCTWATSGPARSLPPAGPVELAGDGDGGAAGPGRRGGGPAPGLAGRPAPHRRGRRGRGWPTGWTARWPAPTSGPDRVPLWQRAVGGLQWLLALVALAGALWLLVLVVLGFFQLDDVVPLPRVQGMPLPTLLLVGGLLAGLLLAVVARPLVGLRARRRGAGGRAPAAGRGRRGGRGRAARRRWPTSRADADRLPRRRGGRRPLSRSVPVEARRRGARAAGCCAARSRSARPEGSRAQTCLRPGRFSQP